MTRDETLKFLMLIKLAYPSSYRDLDSNGKLMTIDLWHRIFKNTELSVMRLALEHFVKTNRFAPTIAEICDELKGIYCEASLKCFSAPKGEACEFYRSIMAQTEDYNKSCDSYIRFLDSWDFYSENH